MKKLLSLTLALALTFVFASCTQKNSENEVNKENNENNEIVNNENVGTEDVKTDSVVYENVDLLALADRLYASFNQDELPMLGSMEITSEDFEYFTFIPYADGLKAVVSEPMMGSIAHSVVLVEAGDAETAKKVAEDMKTNANPRKWICVEAEKVLSATNGNIAMLVMSDSKADKIVEAFKAFTAETMPVLSESVNDENSEETSETQEESDIETETNVDTTEDEVVSNAPAVVPEVDVPAVMPEVEDVPAVLPEEPKADIDVPATMPEEDVPAVMPEVTPDVEADKEETDAPVADDGVTIDKLYEIADKLYVGINPEDMPMVGTMELMEETFEYSAFVPYNASYLAVESMPMIGAMPHSVVIVKTNSDEEALALAENMKANANPRKWVCVSARSVKSASKGQYAILVMTSYEVMPGEDIDEAKAEEMSVAKSEERANLIINNFLAAV